MLVTGLASGMESISKVFEIAGVIVIMVGFVLALVRAGVQLFGRHDASGAYDLIRSIFGKSVLLGLEVLVAADLIRTIAVNPSLDNLYVLLLLVIIRTFLSWALEVELDGAWPWRKKELEVREREANAETS